MAESTAGRPKLINRCGAIEMAITVKFFAVYRDIMGRSEVSLSAGAECTVAGLYEQLLGDRVDPRLRKVTLFAVNEQYAPADTLVRDGDRVAFIPPVSGG